MLSSELSETVLSVGCEYKHPKGGIAQVMNTYYECIFSEFKCVVNSGGTNKIIKLWRLIWSLTQTAFLLLFNSKIKIIHIHTASNISFRRSALWVKIAKIKHRKVVMHVHGGGFKEYYDTNPKWIKSVLDQCDCIITLSESWKEYFTKENNCNNVEIVKNVVPNPIINKIPKKDNRSHLLFLGLITEEKGIFDFIEMLGQNRNDLKDKVILHIGGNGKVEKLKSMINDLSLSDCVIYEGFVSGKKKTDLLNLCDIFILPSYIEGLPISILEAMSYSMPILTTPVGGIPEIVKDGINGKLFSPGNISEMDLALNGIIIDANLISEMGSNSYKMVTDHLPENVERQLEKIYTDLIK